MKRLLIVKLGLILLICGTAHAEDYKLEKNDVEKWIVRVSDGAQIPYEPKNRDYQDFLKWVEAGNEPQPADE